MTDDFETEALHYLLDELEPGRRAAFEGQLTRDPAARAALKTCADSLTRFACETAPAEPMAPIDQRLALAAILDATNGPQAATSSVPSNVIPWARYLWPVAAAVLLGLNLLNFERPLSPVPGRESPADSVAQNGGSAPVVSDSDAPVPAEDAEAGTEPTVPPAGPVEAAEAGKGLLAGATRPGQSDAQRRFEKLREDYTDLQRSNAVLRAQYETVVRHLADRAIVEKNLGRIAAMELVDASSYARGERKGLMDVARGILTEPGVVVAEVITPPPTETTKPQNGEVGSAFAPATTEDPKLTATPAPEAYAWSVFDEKEHRGYLNLYNLPNVPGDQALQLWVKPLDSETYQLVGEVPPQFQGGNGSVFYTLPETSLPPSEILITQEARTATPAVPSAAVVLRGP